MPSTLRETATGFARTGDWLDVVEHGEHVSCALVELDAIRDDFADSVAAWERWRPKADERLRRDVGVRTADHTSGHGDDTERDPRWRRGLRRVERFLYLHVMTLVSPYYFDTPHLHASIDRHDSLRRRQRYRLDISVVDDDLRARMRELLYEYETSVPRWHLAAAKTTETVVAAEGHDLSPREETDATDAPLQHAVNLSQLQRAHAPADD
ncbi:hypothetical protein SAMN04487948_10883 [Halogranum amylolyticum]|uniref:Uncharacterized protein n=1 Tax=Halogranum amylolyticum TaxID=660520 RepID=A0A1H8TT21_9EURY|nr:DUF5828 family protein [Halogranum amylolyticum]SEO93774.1 hypothetical protein SAMN04487948_10883 [Halogranum amylolyticum]